MYSENNSLFAIFMADDMISVKKTILETLKLPHFHFHLHLNENEMHCMLAYTKQCLITIEV